MRSPGLRLPTLKKGSDPLFLGSNGRRTSADISVPTQGVKCLFFSEFHFGLDQNYMQVKIAITKVVKDSDVFVKQ
jgi:hypothetical protein